MELNSILFPVPKVSYTCQDVEGSVMFIPRHYKYTKSFRRMINKSRQEHGHHVRNLQSLSKTSLQNMLYEDALGRGPGAALRASSEGVFKEGGERDFKISNAKGIITE